MELADEVEVNLDLLSPLVTSVAGFIGYFL